MQRPVSLLHSSPFLHTFPVRRSIIRGGLYWSNPVDASTKRKRVSARALGRVVCNDCTASVRTVKRKKKTKRRGEAEDPTKADHGRDAARNEEPTPVAFNIRLAPRKVGLPNVTLSSLSHSHSFSVSPSRSLAPRHCLSLSLFVSPLVTPHRLPRTRHRTATGRVTILNPLHHLAAYIYTKGEKYSYRWSYLILIVTVIVFGLYVRREKYFFPVDL